MWRVAFVLVFVGKVAEEHLIEFIWMHCERGVRFEGAVDLDLRVGFKSIERISQ